MLTTRTISNGRGSGCLEGRVRALLKYCVHHIHVSSMQKFKADAYTEICLQQSLEKHRGWKIIDSMRSINRVQNSNDCKLTPEKVRGSFLLCHQWDSLSKCKLCTGDYLLLSIHLHKLLLSNQTSLCWELLTIAFEYNIVFGPKWLNHRLNCIVIYQQLLFRFFWFTIIHKGYFYQSFFISLWKQRLYIHVM